ncbi:uncharacterized protein YecE (DUF72 family) [Cupriavidus metallidurans]|jgi:uncharacterized protein YecE (DUF72 family)|uniref:DUF72 domain-containing protein n=1 Tax=Cupriavidus metallidurans (strain ATCC 43123 / DSM 2839 / NBRC 102507 / CH34) TaxID=266264 RepID=Q1LSH6_CUPMC|nr:DUF72 domain-containing protein [Cupriavidus metallidurans]ABF06900.1 conserved hypothetical protein [Cupriavidus metallidurans CH34]AVA32133.1 DUF72 domain-containing protein [Cupriavidus metallidurans]KWW33880.1 hypothetical protein AU374_05004 [Cupriavidus metallidurans]MDE4916325.1 DUF72 domain-containing protein [Cupriavidus metallidurans]QGS28736.1 DUF72 domain-containing protein [Cupriavidus metallidurans]
MAVTRQGKSASNIHIGIGGWNYAPWRDNFYPAGLAQARELEYASRHLTAIEINSTYHGTQKRTSFANWRDATPDGFVFSVKASRFATNRRVLAEGSDSISRFIDSGIAELREKLGPVVWQFAPTKQFVADDFEAFLNLLPTSVEGVKLRHVMEVRHESFMCDAYLKLARKFKAATVFTDSPKFPSFADLTSDFVYARLMNADEKVATGYAPKVLDQWAQRASAWAGGKSPDDLPRVEDEPAGKLKPKEAFLFFINGAKERAPAAAGALLERLGWVPTEAVPMKASTPKPPAAKKIAVVKTVTRKPAATKTVARKTA